MAETPDSAVELSDAELDDIVRAAEAEGGADVDGPAVPVATPADADEVDDAEDTESPDEGTQQETVVAPESKVAPAEPVAETPPIPAEKVAEKPVGKPFQFKASGGVHTLAGALELEDGSIVVPKDAQADLRTRLASEAELRVNFKALQRETTRKVNALKAENTDKQLEAEAIIALFGDIEKMTPEQRFDYFENFEKEKPRLQLEVERKQLARDRAALAAERNPQLSPEEKQEQRAEAVERELRVTYDRVMGLPEVQALDPEDVAAVFRKYAKKPDRLIVAGEKDGEEIFDETDVIEELERLVRIQTRFAAQIAATPKSVAATLPQSAASKNATRNADLNPIPPTVANRAPVAAVPAKPKGFKGDREKFKNAFMRGDLDED